MPVGVYETKAVIKGIPVRTASNAGPAGIREGCPKKSTSIPVRERSRSATSAMSEPVRARCISVAMER